MKQFLSIVLLSTVFLFSCKKDDINNTDEKVGHSRVTNFPEVSIKGDRLIILNEGGTYTEAGATALVKGAEVAYQTTGTVNTAVPGVYNLAYAAQNQDGFSATDWRTVVVIGNDVASNDLSGNYDRAATGTTTVWTKTAPGVYEIDNPGGAATGYGLKAIVVNYQGNKIAIPRQFGVNPDGSPIEVSSRAETYNPETSSYSWIFLASGYGTAARDFVKQ
ncbi:MAG TPA: immunoglobulin-like domain-containing protein [Flavisolibacter sp.]|nr:immunoglobulin-like domain-containing protein [Flavisolibacter sp.]